MKTWKRLINRILTFALLAFWAGIAYRTRYLEGSPRPEEALYPFVLLAVLVLILQGMAEALGGAIDCIDELDAEEDLDAPTGESATIRLTGADSKATLPASSSNPST